MTSIKICGVKTADDAYFAAACGADYVGIVMHAQSKRYVDPNTAKDLAKAIRRGGAIPVAVFFDETKEEILQAVKGTEITTLQTYADIDLPEAYTTIYANPSLGRMKRSSDIVLLDGPVPGSGELLRPEHLPSSIPGSFFLAGGITPDNVIEILKTFHPTGVDVSSGVESQGTKDVTKIQSFIEKVRDYDKTIR